MFHIATKPLEQPTAMSLGDNHAKHVQILEDGIASKTGETALTICQSVEVKEPGTDKKKAFI